MPDALPNTPRSVALDRDRHVWVRRGRWWKCVTNKDDRDITFPEQLVEHFGPITVIYDAGAELL